jgi:hypothetical protein
MEKFFNLLTAPANSERPRWYTLFEQISLAILGIGGAFLWAYYLNFGRGPFDLHDWAIITWPRLFFLRDAFVTGQLPLHISDPCTLGCFTTRYFTVPDVYASPQIFLLRFLTPGIFLVVNTILLYGIGYWGLLRLRAKYQLSLLSFAPLFLLFNFNGNQLAHFTAGHATWWAAFLYSWLILWLLELLEKGGRWRWISKTAFLLFAILLQGGYHQFIWGLYFIGFLAITRPERFWTLFRLAIAAVLLSAFRLLPPFMNLGAFDNKFIAGYPLFSNFWNALVNPAVPGDITLSGGMTKPIGMWEFTLYVGMAGALFLIYFGLYRPMRQPKNPHTALYLPIIGILILSLDRVFHYLRIFLPLPFLTGERVSARMIILPFLFVLVLAVIELQRWLSDPQRVSWQKWLPLGLLLFLSNDLWQNFRQWRVLTAAEKFGPPTTFTASKWFTANQMNDTPYFILLGVGLALTLITAAILSYLSWREQKASLKS